MGPRAGLDDGKSRPTGIRSPDRPSRSQSLYRLSYSAHGEDIRSKKIKLVRQYTFTVLICFINC